MSSVRTLATRVLPVVLILFAVVSTSLGQIHLSEAPRNQEEAIETGPIIDPNWSVARVWDETLLDAIRLDRPKPPVHARNLFHLSMAMWDAWAAYDTRPIGYIYTEKHKAVDVEAARREAISYAALRLLQYRFVGGGIDQVDFQPCQPGAEVSQADFLDKMNALGYDPSITTTEGDSPVAVGNRIGAMVIAYGQADGAAEGFDLCYPDPSFYMSLNPPLIFKLPGTVVNDPNHWQALAFDFLVLQNGVVIGEALQSFVGVAWGDVASFAIPPIPPGGTPPPEDCLVTPNAVSPIFDPGCAPQLGGVGHQEVVDSVVELILFSSYVDPTDGVDQDFSPAVYGNKLLGTDDPAGHGINPITCEPYPPNVIRRGDWARVIAEFWADGPDSETPPGHWNTLANYVTDLLSEKRIGGVGRIVNDLEWDVKLYPAINGAAHDAAIAAWGTKHYYDSSRPITLIRHMGGLGQSTSDRLPSYDANGLPLVRNLIELITRRTIGNGGRHQHLSAFCAGGGLNEGQFCVSDDDCPDDGVLIGFCDSSVGKIAIRSWRGEPDDPENDLGGVGWVRAIDWITYQASNFITPPFPGYTSGHSTFSRAGAVVLSRITGNEFFPDGLGTFTAVAGDYLDFEDGPSQTVELRWATYADAADEAGLSRRYGGIHPWFDDFPGRIQGQDIGQSAWERAQEFYNQGPIPDPPAGKQCECSPEDPDGDGDGTPDCDDGCPNDANKTEPGICGCGTSDADNDGDNVADCNDGCPADPDKTEPGVCGCGTADTDSDGDQVPDCQDGCPDDPDKLEPGVCGCGTADTDSDGDGTPDCIDECDDNADKDGDGTPDCVDGCPTDPDKTEPGVCGCGVSDADNDGDGTPNCNDGCPRDPNKTDPGVCGCGTADTDSDGDGTPNCNDGCPADPDKTEPGVCGCGTADGDGDGDGTHDCNDGCPADPDKTEPGACGCGTADTDSDGDGTPDCVDECDDNADKDGDGTPDCVDGCPADPDKTEPGTCGCGVSDADEDGNGTADCNDGPGGPDDEGDDENGDDENGDEGGNGHPDDEGDDGNGDDENGDDGGNGHSDDEGDDDETPDASGWPWGDTGAPQTDPGQGWNWLLKGDGLDDEPGSQQLGTLPPPGNEDQKRRKERRRDR